MLLFYLSMVDDDRQKDKFEQLYYLYRQRMWKAAYDIVRDEYLAEDAVQDSFIKLARYVGNIGEPESSCVYWLVITVVRNTAKNMYNKRKRETLIQDISGEELAVGSAASAEDQAIDSITPEMIMKAIDRMEEKYREILLMCAYHGFNCNQAASLLAITPQNARKRLQRAREKLETILREEQLL